MFGPLFYLWQFAGIAVYADLSLVLLLAFWVLPSLLSFNPGAALDTLIFAFLLFGSIMLHEFGHSLTALRLNYRVHRIVLNVLGGAALLDTSAKRASHEFMISIAGPLVSVLVGTIGWFTWPLVMKAGMPDTALIIGKVAIVNFYLAMFNLLPAFPMDGGRVLRSMLTKRLGFLKATMIAARVGQVLAFFAGGFSVLRMLADANMIRDFDPITIGMFRLDGGVILLMIAIFIFVSADREYQMVLQEHSERPFRWGESEFREGDGDSWRNNTGDISKDVEIGPPPFERNSGWLASIRRFFRNLFKR